MGPNGVVFAGNLFEGLAMRYTFGETAHPGLFGPVAQMTRRINQENFPNPVHLQKI